MRIMKSGILVLGIVCCLATSSCVTTKAEGEQMMADISRLKNEISTLQQDRSDLSITVDKKLESFDSRISALEDVTYRQANTESMEKERLRSEIASLRGQLEEAQRGFEQGLKEDEMAPKEKEDHFTWAKAAFDEGNFSAAFVRVDSFLEKYKDDVQFGASAHLMKGDAAVELGKNENSKPAKKEYYKKAVAAYYDLLTRFPKSPRLPEAYYKVGEALETMGFTKDAKVAYEEVSKKYKKSSFAKKANQRLQALNKKKKK